MSAPEQQPDDLGSSAAVLGPGPVELEALDPLGELGPLDGLDANGRDPLHGLDSPDGSPRGPGPVSDGAREDADEPSGAPEAFVDPMAAGGDFGDEPTSAALFDGDDGGLELMQRRALVVLIKQRFLSEQSHGPEFRALVSDPRPIRSRLNDLFMDLVLDVERGVAYKRQVHPEGGGRFPTLLHDTPWGREETVVLVYLRSRYRHETAAGSSRVFVDRDSVYEFVDQHRPSHATDQAGDLRRTSAAIESLCTAGLLIGRKDGPRFEINRAIEVLLPMDKLRLLLGWLRDTNGGRTAAPGGATHSPDALDQDRAELASQPPDEHTDEHTDDEHAYNGPAVPADGGGTR